MRCLVMIIRQHHSNNAHKMQWKQLSFFAKENGQQTKSRLYKTNYIENWQLLLCTFKRESRTKHTQMVNGMKEFHLYSGSGKDIKSLNAKLIVVINSFIPRVECEKLGHSKLSERSLEVWLEKKMMSRLVNVCV